MCCGPVYEQGLALVVGEDVRDELMEWMLTHTSLTQQGMRAAIARVHAEMPHLLVSQPTPAAVYDGSVP